MADDCSFLYFDIYYSDGKFFPTHYSTSQCTSCDDLHYFWSNFLIGWTMWDVTKCQHPNVQPVANALCRFVKLNWFAKNGSDIISRGKCKICMRNDILIN